MKKVLLLTSFLSLLCFVACSNADSNKNANAIVPELALEENPAITIEAEKTADNTEEIINLEQASEPQEIIVEAEEASEPQEIIVEAEEASEPQEIIVEAENVEFNKQEAETNAKEEVASIVSKSGSPTTQNNPTLPVHNPRLYEEQMVVLPNGISITTTVSYRDGREYLWVSDIAPIAIFNKTFLYDHADTDNYIVDDTDFEFEYYYLTVKPDFYQNHITAVEIDAETYFQIYDAYAAQANK